MRRTATLVTTLLVLCTCLNVSAAQDRVLVLISYHSQHGHTRAMAEAVERGARSVKGVTVKLLGVSETTKEDLLAADAIIVGSPVHNANASPEVVSFIDRWPFEGAPLRDKLGAAFVTGGGISAGEEIAQLSILHSMMIFGMIIVGGPDWISPFGASAVTGEPPFDTSAGLAPAFIKKGEALGRRVAELAVKWKRSR
jgi:NAD(P)H dehydrogenase (quinone)